MDIIFDMPLLALITPKVSLCWGLLEHDKMVFMGSSLTIVEWETLREKTLQIAHFFAPPKNSMPPNFAEKTFAKSHKATEPQNEISHYLVFTSGEQ